MDAISVTGLGKRFGSIAPLRDCSFSVPAGSVFGLLGQNGAGKTTLLRILLGYLQPTSGGARVCGFDVQRQSLDVRSRTSYLPGDARLYRTMRGTQVIKLFAGLHSFGDSVRGLEIAERLQLDVGRRVMFMSTGMRQKLALAVVLGSRAPLIILDEPTANLDPNVRESILRLIREVRDEGRTVVLSSHIFSDIDDTCDHVAILREGRIVTEQDMKSLGKIHIVATRMDPSRRAQLKETVGTQAFVRHAFLKAENCVELHLSGDPEHWMPWLLEQPLSHLNIEQAGIRSVYQQFHSVEQLVDLAATT